MGHECTPPCLSDASRSECGAPGCPASATAARERGAPAPHCAPIPGVPYGTSAIGQSSSARSAAPSAHAQVSAQCTRQRACPVPMRQTTAGMPFPIERLLSMRSRGSALPGHRRSLHAEPGIRAPGAYAPVYTFFRVAKHPGGDGFFCIFPCRGLNMAIIAIKRDRVKDRKKRLLLRFCLDATTKAHKMQLLNAKRI